MAASPSRRWWFHSWQHVCKMNAPFIKPQLDALGAAFGPLDNAVEKWASLASDLLTHLDSIHSAIDAHFPAESAPQRTFQQGVETYQSLLAAIKQSGQPGEVLATASGFLNLRFYIYLNGFLSACQESLEKYAFNDGLDPSDLVEKSYYRPYFFARAVYSTEEMIAMLEDDLAQLHAAPRDRKGILLALRIRKGAVSTLTESYCPTHPLLYPWVQRLEGVPTKNSPEMIEEILIALKAIQQHIAKEKI